MKQLGKTVLFGGMGFGFILFILGIFGIIGMFCWPYSINHWLIFMGKEPCIVWWQGFLMGFAPFLGQASIPVMIITWILMMFLM